MALTCAILLLSEVLSAIEYMTLMVTRAAERQPSGKNDDEWFTLYEIEQTFPVTLHFVKKDDNLYELSKLYNVPLNQLIEDI